LSSNAARGSVGPSPQSDVAVSSALTAPTLSSTSDKVDGSLASVSTVVQAPPLNTIHRSHVIFALPSLSHSNAPSAKIPSACATLEYPPVPSFTRADPNDTSMVPVAARIPLVSNAAFTLSVRSACQCGSDTLGFRVVSRGCPLPRPLPLPPPP